MAMYADYHLISFGKTVALLLGNGAWFLPVNRHHVIPDKGSLGEDPVIIISDLPYYLPITR